MSLEQPKLVLKRLVVSQIKSTKFVVGFLLIVSFTLPLSTRVSPAKGAKLRVSINVYSDVSFVQDEVDIGKIAPGYKHEMDILSYMSLALKKLGYAEPVVSNPDFTMHVLHSKSESGDAFSVVVLTPLTEEYLSPILNNVDVTSRYFRNHAGVLSFHRLYTLGAIPLNERCDAIIADVNARLLKKALEAKQIYEKEIQKWRRERVSNPNLKPRSVLPSTLPFITAD